MEEFEDSDSRFEILCQAMQDFDREQAIRKWVDTHCQDEIFQRILAELNYPSFWRIFGPRKLKKISVIAMTNDPTNPLSPAYLLKKLRDAAEAGNASLWNRHRRSYYARVMALRRHMIDHECVVRHQYHIWDLITFVAGKAEVADKQRVVIWLLGFDLEFLNVPAVQRVLRQMELSQDRKFRNRLIRALEGSGRHKAWLRHRNRYALGMVQGFGFHDKASSEWAAFFRAYDAWLKKFPRTAKERGFPSFERAANVGEAIIRHKIPKEKATTRHREPKPLRWSGRS